MQMQGQGWTQGQGKEQGEEAEGQQGVRAGVGQLLNQWVT